MVVFDNTANESKYSEAEPLLVRSLAIDENRFGKDSPDIVTDLNNLFDPQKGIYTNPMQEGQDWERPASIELIYPDGNEGFHINAGLRMQGGAGNGRAVF